MAAVPAGGTPQEFDQFLRREFAYWGKVVKVSGIKIDQ
jgi:tripartite-type tricarboxylate transporter receptor subunit TctC